VAGSGEPAADSQEHWREVHVGSIHMHRRCSCKLMVVLLKASASWLPPVCVPWVL
jgi:hypothetical protein